MKGLRRRAARTMCAGYVSKGEGTSMSQTTAGIALVTGASRRIGAAIARDLAKDGWRIAIHYRHSQHEAESLAAEIRSLGSDAVTIPADLADLDDALSLV